MEVPDPEDEVGHVEYEFGLIHGHLWRVLLDLQEVLHRLIVEAVGPLAELLLQRSPTTIQSPYLDVVLQPDPPGVELGGVLGLAEEREGLAGDGRQPGEGLLEDLVQRREVRVALLELPLVGLLGDGHLVVDRSVFLLGVRLVRRDLDLY